MAKVGILLLAAGNSSRLGEPKQLVQWQGTSLLRYMTNVACSASADFVTVVLGSRHEECSAVIEDLPAHRVTNMAWEDGMGSSIAFGTSEMLAQNPEIEGILIMLCDQVAVSTALLSGMIQSFQATQVDLVVSHYGEAQGPPVLFPKRFFPDLLQLKGMKGAKSVWEKASSVMRVEFPLGSQDLDTPGQYRRLQCLYGQSN